MGAVRFLVVVLVFVLIAWLYRSLPQNLNALALRYAQLSPRFRAAQKQRLERELLDYRAMLENPAAFQAEALHRQALIVVSAATMLLALLLLIASQVVQPRADAALAPYFAPVDAVLVLFFVFSLVGFRLAVFRSWMFLHRERNLGRMQRMIATLGGGAADNSQKRPVLK
jgi:hypothetical protein